MTRINGYNEGIHNRRVYNLGEWSDYEKLIISELERLNETLDRLTKTIEETRLSTAIEIAQLKIKSGVWGFLAGSIPVVLALAMQYLKK